MADERRVDADLGFAREVAPARDEAPPPAEDDEEAAYEDAWYQVLKASSSPSTDDAGGPTELSDAPGGTADPS